MLMPHTAEVNRLLSVWQQAIKGGDKKGSRQPCRLPQGVLLTTRGQFNSRDSKTDPACSLEKQSGSILANRLS